MNALHDVPDFGKIEAESDDLLYASFQHHPAIDSVLKDDRFLILGRKGSGKTAIFKQLENPAPDRFFAGYSFVDYPWNHHDKQITPDAVAQERYVHSWKYLILVTVAKMIVNQDQSVPWSEESGTASNDLRDFLMETYSSTDPRLSDIFSPSKRIGLLDRLSIDLKILKIDSLAATIKDLPLLVQDLNRKLQDLVLSALNPDNQYVVGFDELDRGFDPKDDAYTQRLIGLLLAARDIARASNIENRRLCPVVFLRSDIYHEHLNFEDKNKLTDTYAFEIEWETKGAPNLKDMMIRRFKERLGNPTAAWEDVFDESREMTGRQSKYVHIVTRGLHRPRDIIKFCNCVLDAYKLRYNADPTDRPNQFVNEDINNARLQYSKHFRRELEDENFKSEPGFKVWLQALRDVEAQEFTRSEFEEAMTARGDKVTEVRTAHQILSILFELSVVGYLRIGGRGGGSKYVFKYLEPDADLSIHASEFKVHSGLLDDLGIKKFSRS
jgi:hypothetical protein